MKIGIVGMPNAGKSTLFNALTAAGAETGDYPFTTVEPNVAVVPVPDERLERVARDARLLRDRPRGDRLPRHRGPGQGRLAGRGARKPVPGVDPRDRRDLPRDSCPQRRVRGPSGGSGRPGRRRRADRDRAARRRPRIRRAPPRAGRRSWPGPATRGRSPSAMAGAVVEALRAGRPAREVPVPEAAPDALRKLSPLTAKPVLYVVNVDEGETEAPPELLAHAEQMEAKVVVISARVEAELRELDAARGGGDAQRARHRAIRPGAPDPRRLRAARPGQLLHRGHGQGGDGAHPEAGRHRLRRGRPGPRRHPEGVRPRRGDRLGRAASTPAATPPPASGERCASRAATTSSRTAT